jgi:hypothetical protein
VSKGCAKNVEAVPAQNPANTSIYESESDFQLNFFYYKVFDVF